MSTLIETPALIEQITYAHKEGKRALLPGSGGWSEADLRQAEHREVWERERFELVEGVVCMMAPAWFDNTRALFHLTAALIPQMVKLYGGGMGGEAELVLKPERVVKPDAMYLSREQEEHQRNAAKAANQERDFVGIRVPPLLVIECVSQGHEHYDRVTKRAWYAEFGVRNYWLLEPIDKRLLCLKLDGVDYLVDAEGSGTDVLQPTLLRGSEIKLGDLWM